MDKNNIQPAAIAVGLTVLGGIVLFSMSKKRRCEKLPGIYVENGPLHLTQAAQDAAFEAARYKLREYMLSGKAYKLSDVHLHVADELRDCTWENLESTEQKAVWSGITQIVNEVNQRAKENPDEFLKSF